MNIQFTRGLGQRFPLLVIALTFSLIASAQPPSNGYLPVGPYTLVCYCNQPYRSVCGDNPRTPCNNQYSCQQVCAQPCANPQCLRDKNMVINMYYCNDNDQAVKWWKRKVGGTLVPTSSSECE